MLISHRHQFIYTKTVKTGSTSAEVYFEPFCLPEVGYKFSHARPAYEGEEGVVGYRGGAIKGKKWFNHMSAKQIRTLIGEELWGKYYKFCVIRNPFEKMVSGFYYNELLQKNRTSWKELIKKVIRPLPIDKVKGEHPVERFRDWVAKGGFIADSDKYLIDNTLALDFYIRNEQMAEDIERVCNHLQIEFDASKIPGLKVGERDRTISYKDYYDEKTIRKVEQLYAFELKHFGYELG